MKKTVFQTAEGNIICRTSCRMAAAERAIKKAAQAGYLTLYSVEPSGQKFNYTHMLERYHHQANNLL